MREAHWSAWGRTEQARRRCPPRGRSWSHLLPREKDGWLRHFYPGSFVLFWTFAAAGLWRGDGEGCPARCLQTILSLTTGTKRAHGNLGREGGMRDGPRLELLWLLTSCLCLSHDLHPNDHDLMCPGSHSVSHRAGLQLPLQLVTFKKAQIRWGHYLDLLCLKPFYGTLWITGWTPTCGQHALEWLTNASCFICSFLCFRAGALHSVIWKSHCLLAQGQTVSFLWKAHHAHWLFLLAPLHAPSQRMTCPSVRTPLPE